MNNLFVFSFYKLQFIVIILKNIINLHLKWYIHANTMDHTIYLMKIIYLT